VLRQVGFTIKGAVSLGLKTEPWLKGDVDEEARDPEDDPRPRDPASA
jgi:hypothetical protein